MAQTRASRDLLKETESKDSVRCAFALAQNSFELASTTSSLEGRDVSSQRDELPHLADGRLLLGAWPKCLRKAVAKLAGLP